MFADAAPERVVLEGDDQPFVVLLSDSEPTRLHQRAKEFCDESWPYWSRSYSGVIALVAGWRHRVGVDVEFLHRHTQSSWSLRDERFQTAIMTSEERKQSLTLEVLDPEAAAVSLWCSKEALAKALGSPLEMDPARLTGPAMWDGARRGSWAATLLDVATLECDAVGWVVYESPDT